MTLRRTDPKPKQEISQSADAIEQCPHVRSVTGRKALTLEILELCDCRSRPGWSYQTSSFA